MAKPVRDVCAPEHLAPELNITIDQAGGVEDLVHVKCMVGEYDAAISAAEFEGLKN